MTNICWWWSIWVVVVLERLLWYANNLHLLLNSKVPFPPPRGLLWRARVCAREGIVPTYSSLVSTKARFQTRLIWRFSLALSVSVTSYYLSPLTEDKSPPRSSQNTLEQAFGPHRLFVDIISSLDDWNEQSKLLSTTKEDEGSRRSA